MSWEQLLSIAADAQEERRAEAVRGPMACPNDGEPLTPAPDGGLFCQFDGWRPDPR